MQGRVHGARVSWPGAGGGGGPASPLTIEQAVGFGSVWIQNSPGKNSTLMGTADLPLGGWTDAGSDDRLGAFFPVDSRYNGSDIEIRWGGAYAGVNPSPDTIGFDFKARWLGNDQSTNVGFTAMAANTQTSHTAGKNHPSMIAPYVTLNGPDGTYNAGDVLMVRGVFNPTNTSDIIYTIYWVIRYQITI